MSLPQARQLSGSRSAIRLSADPCMRGAAERAKVQVAVAAVSKQHGVPTRGMIIMLNNT